MPDNEIKCGLYFLPTKLAVVSEYPPNTSVLEKLDYCDIASGKSGKSSEDLTVIAEKSKEILEELQLRIAISATEGSCLWCGLEMNNYLHADMTDEDIEDWAPEDGWVEQDSDLPVVNPETDEIDEDFSDFYWMCPQCAEKVNSGGGFFVQFGELPDVAN